MFNTKYLPSYLITLGIIVVVGSYSNQVKKYFSGDDDEYEYDMIKTYLLNESPLYGNNRPKLWIHSKYEMNARVWKDFHSRNTHDLNQDYLHLTIKTIINHCGEDFNICLIDDNSFGKLLPNWDVELSTVAEPIKNYFRNLAMTQLLYIYGGMVVPNSFVCSKSLKSMYDEFIGNNKAFVCEMINNSSNIAMDKPTNRFIPSLEFMGSNKENPAMLELNEYIKFLYRDGHITKEHIFRGMVNQKCNELISKEKLHLVDGKYVGVKTNRNKPVLLEEICEEAYLDLHKDTLGIYIPSEDILNRTKYQWFANASAKHILESNMIIAKYLKASIMDTTNEYYKGKKERTVVTI
jgi:hypothetical protein